MISLVAAPLQINSDCCQVSCHFDKILFQDLTASQLGIVLPSILNGAVQKRKAEFVAGRYCASVALAQLDSNLDATTKNFAIGVGANREPLWPEGFVGSITHTNGYASSIVARRNKARSLGVDSETWIESGTVGNVARQILTTGENFADHRHLFESPRHYLTMVFSAKESLFKCLFPIVNKYFDFHTAVIAPLPSGSTTDGEFRFELLVDLHTEFPAGYSGHGRYCIQADRVHTMVMLKP